MDIYHIWFDLKPGTDDRDFATALTAFLDHLEERRVLEAWRLTRCKLGLKPDAFAEFHVMIETLDLAQLDKAFGLAAARKGEVDTLHFAANQMVQNVKFALYRDWPDHGPDG